MQGVFEQGKLIQLRIIPDVVEPGQQVVDIPTDLYEQLTANPRLIRKVKLVGISPNVHAVLPLSTSTVTPLTPLTNTSNADICIKLNSTLSTVDVLGTSTPIFVSPASFPLICTHTIAKNTEKLPVNFYKDFVDGVLANTVICYTADACNSIELSISTKLPKFEHVSFQPFTERLCLEEGDWFSKQWYRSTRVLDKDFPLIAFNILDADSTPTARYLFDSTSKHDVSSLEELLEYINVGNFNNLGELKDSLPQTATHSVGTVLQEFPFISIPLYKSSNHIPTTDVFFTYHQHTHEN